MEQAKLKLDRDQMSAYLRRLRRDLHQHAEVKWTEYRTSSVVYQQLEAVGCTQLFLGSEIAVRGPQMAYPSAAEALAQQQRAIAQGADPKLVARMEGLPGVVAVLDSGRPGPVVALRFDMDALEGQEDSRLDRLPVKEGFISVNDGCMHACGHDGHTSIGLALARLLLDNPDSWQGKVKLIFQPAEEGGGGAAGIVARGVLDDVQYFFAGHVGMASKDGKPVVSHGLIAGIDDFLEHRRFNVHYQGQAAHPCGDPHLGKNALLAAAQAALAIHNIAPHSEGLMRVNVGTLHAGEARNTVPPSATMLVEVRGVSEAIADYAERRLRTILQHAAEMYEVRCEIDAIGNTPSARSDDEAIDIVLAVAQQVDWFNTYHRWGSIGGSDDASEMLLRVQANGGMGTYIGLGADFAAGFHRSDFDFDEEVMLPAVELFMRIIVQVTKGETHESSGLLCKKTVEV